MCCNNKYWAVDYQVCFILADLDFITDIVFPTATVVPTTSDVSSTVIPTTSDMTSTVNPTTSDVTSTVIPTTSDVTSTVIPTTSDVTSTVTPTTTETPAYPDCQAALDAGHTTSGVYTIYHGEESMEASCDMETTGKGYNYSKYARAP